jgi:hypothetical protein
VKRLLDWAGEAAQWITLIGGFALFCFLVVPELDARFGLWWLLVLIVVFALWDNFLRR